ncbi:hypothetical protein GQ457_14G017640 [Hibiscus cannabinus]
MLSSAKSALLVHRVPVLVLAYWYCKLSLLAIGFLALQYQYEHMGIGTPSVEYRYCLHRIGTCLHPSDRWGFEKLGYRSLKTLMGIGTLYTVSIPKA